MKQSAVTSTFLLISSISYGSIEASAAQHTFQSRIVGGHPSAAGAFPYFTTVSKSSLLVCGASLIHEDIVLTAAHCEGAFDSGVRVGAENFDDDGIFRNVVLEIRHPDYDETTVTNDIMLLKLQTPIVGHKTVRWAKDKSAPIAGENLTVVGFGAVEENGDLSPVLQQVSVPAMNNKICSSKYGGNISIEVMFCAGDSNGGEDSCQGDSGGPIIDKNNTQVGIVSWGEGCATKQHPGVYTRVGAFADWIESKICKHSSNPPATCNITVIPGGNGTNPVGNNITNDTNIEDNNDDDNNTDDTNNDDDNTDDNNNDDDNTDDNNNDDDNTDNSNNDDDNTDDNTDDNNDDDNNDDDDNTDDNNSN